MIFSKNLCCWTTHLVKINNQTVIFQPHQIVGVNLMGGEFASPTNPEKGCSGKLKIDNAVCMSNDPIGYNKYILHGPGHNFNMSSKHYN